MTYGTYEGDTTMHKEAYGASGFALGVLVGAVAGAGLALLFAPKPGSELRGELGESMTSLKDKAARRLRNLADRAATEVNDLSNTVGKARSTAAGAAREMADQASETLRADGRTRV